MPVVHRRWIEYREYSMLHFAMYYRRTDMNHHSRRKISTASFTDFITRAIVHWLFLVDCCFREKTDLVLDDDAHLEDFWMKRKPNKGAIENVTGQLALIGDMGEGWSDHWYTAIVLFPMGRRLSEGWSNRSALKQKRVLGMNDARERTYSDDIARLTSRFDHAYRPFLPRICHDEHSHQAQSKWKGIEQINTYDEG